MPATAGDPHRTLKRGDPRVAIPVTPCVTLLSSNMLALSVGRQTRLNPCHPKERQLREHRFNSPLNLGLGHWAVRELLPLWLFSGCDLDGPTH